MALFIEGFEEYRVIPLSEESLTHHAVVSFYKLKSIQPKPNKIEMDYYTLWKTLIKSESYINDERKNILWGSYMDYSKTFMGNDHNKISLQTTKQHHQHDNKLRKGEKEN